MPKKKSVFELEKPEHTSVFMKLRTDRLWKHKFSIFLRPCVSAPSIPFTFRATSVCTKQLPEGDHTETQVTEE